MSAKNTNGDTTTDLMAIEGETEGEGQIPDRPALTVMRPRTKRLMQVTFGVSCASILAGLITVVTVSMNYARADQQQVDAINQVKRELEEVKKEAASVSEIDKRLVRVETMQVAQTQLLVDIKDELKLIKNR